MKSTAFVGSKVVTVIEVTQEEIMKNWGVDNADNPLVSVRCITYNHEPYIAQALDGFLMQKTNFPFEVIVHDDASTDKTADVIREYEKKYPKIIKPIYQTENQYSKRDGSIGRILDVACKGKYIAFCDGDDYWIDENKLQMQVDFLENNPDYGMCYTKAIMYEQNNKKYQGIWGMKSSENINELIYVVGIPTLTVVFSSKIRKKYLEEIVPSDKGWLLGDYPMWLFFSGKSKIKFLDKITSVYRVLPESASHSTNYLKYINYRNSVYAVRHFFIEYFNLDPYFNEKLNVQYIYEIANVYYPHLKWKHTSVEVIANLLRQQIKKHRSKNIRTRYYFHPRSSFSVFIKFEIYLRIVEFISALKQLILKPIRYILKKLGLFDTVKRIVKGKNGD